MSTLLLVLKAMRQRALSTALTILSVMLGVALAIAVIICHREGDRLFVQSNFGFNVLVGPKGDELNMVLNSVYGLTNAQASIPWSVYDDLMRTQQANVKSAIPFMVGDTWKGQRIMATSARLVGSPALDTFRTTLSNLSTDLRTVGRPPANGEVPATRDARVAKVPAVIAAVQASLKPLDAAALAPLDVELVARFTELKASLDRATAMIDPNNPAMTDAGGRIAADAVDGLRLLGGFAAPFEYRAGTPLTLAQGRAYDARKFEGIIGANVAKKLGMKLGDPFHLEHGGNANDVHDETWTTVGILAPTGTAIDETLYIPIVSGLCIPEHEEGLEQIAALTQSPAGGGPRLPPVPAVPTTTATHDDHAHDAHDDHASDGLMTPAPSEPIGGGGHHHHHGEEAYDIDDGRIDLHLTPDKWRVTGIFATTRGEGAQFGQLQFFFRNTPTAMAVNPASTMAKFFNTFLKGPSYVLLALAILVTTVAAISILVSIYNAVVARRRETAILRALGATRVKILTLLCAEAALVGLVGGVLGIVLGHTLAAVGSRYLEATLGSRLAFWVVSWPEVAYLAGVVMLATLAGLVPGLQAYRTAVADNLAAE